MVFIIGWLNANSIWLKALNLSSDALSKINKKLPCWWGSSLALLFHPWQPNPCKNVSGNPPEWLCNLSSHTAAFCRHLLATFHLVLTTDSPSRGFTVCISSRDSMSLFLFVWGNHKSTLVRGHIFPFFLFFFFFSECFPYLFLQTIWSSKFSAGDLFSASCLWSPGEGQTVLCAVTLGHPFQDTSTFQCSGGNGLNLGHNPPPNTAQSQKGYFWGPKSWKIKILKIYNPESGGGCCGIAN